MNITREGNEQYPVNTDQEYPVTNYGQRLSGSWRPNEVYTDLEDRALNKEELVDKLIAMAHDTHHNELFGELVREELLKFDRAR